MSESVHGGRLAASRLAEQGVSHLFTLSGGHLFSLYDGVKHEPGMRLIDVRHEQTAAFAAEGWAKVTRTPGVCALTAGPGVTNGMSAMGSAFVNRSPMIVIGGRAPAVRWGQGSLQELDHLPFVTPLTRSAETVDGPGEIQPALDRAFNAAQGAPGGPAFIDVGLDHFFMEAAPSADPAPGLPAQQAVDAGDLQRAVDLLRGANRPVVMAGTDLYWGRAERELVAFAEALGAPVFTNGQARGCIPGDHELSFSRTRSKALGEADVALVVGVPLDFRLGFGEVFGAGTKIITLQRAAFDANPPRSADIALEGEIAPALGALAEGVAGAPGHDTTHLAELRAAETAARATALPELTSDQKPIHPLRIYGDLLDVLGRDAIIVCDGGDFGSYAGQAVERYEPGTWLDPGPFGCLGAGAGYALAASWPTRIARWSSSTATARSGSRRSSSTPLPATACTSSA